MHAKAKRDEPKDEPKQEASVPAGAETKEVSTSLWHKRKRLFSILGTVLVVLVGGSIVYRHYHDEQNRQAQAEMFQAQYYFEADSLDKALFGDGNASGFEDIIADYGRTEAANLAHFYVGVCYLRKGEWDKALQYLEKFSADDWLVSIRKYTLMGDAYAEKKDFSRAAEYYHKAAKKRPNDHFTPMYLQKAALAYEAAGSYDKALACFQQIVKEHSQSNFGNVQDEAQKQVARLSVLAENPPAPVSKIEGQEEGDAEVVAEEALSDVPSDTTFSDPPLVAPTFSTPSSPDSPPDDGWDDEWEE